MRSKVAEELADEGDAARAAIAQAKLETSSSPRQMTKYFIQNQ